MLQIGSRPVLARSPGLRLVPLGTGLADPGEVAPDVRVHSGSVWPATAQASGHDPNEHHLLVDVGDESASAVSLQFKIKYKKAA